MALALVPRHSIRWVRAHAPDAPRERFQEKGREEGCHPVEDQESNVDHPSYLVVIEGWQAVLQEGKHVDKHGLYPDPGEAVGREDFLKTHPTGNGPGLSGFFLQQRLYHQDHRQ
jgi:hypothetical protein